MVFFDVDGVLVPVRSSWNYLHRHFGVEKTALSVLERFKRGEITYYEWMLIDTSLWIKARGRVTRRDLEEAFENVSVDPGFKNVISMLKGEGKHIVLVSGGVNLLVERVAREVGADECYCNILIFDSGGNLVPGGLPVVPSGSKDVIIKHVLEKLGSSREEAVFVGDSPWDEEAFRSVGLGIMYAPGDETAKPDHGSCIIARSPTEVYDLITGYDNGLVECRSQSR